MPAAAMAEAGMADEAQDMLARTSSSSEEAPSPGSIKVLLVEDEEDYGSTYSLGFLYTFE